MPIEIRLVEDPLVAPSAAPAGPLPVSRDLSPMADPTVPAAAEPTPIPPPFSAAAPTSRDGISAEGIANLLSSGWPPPELRMAHSATSTATTALPPVPAPPTSSSPSVASEQPNLAPPSIHEDSGLVAAPEAVHPAPPDPAHPPNQPGPDTANGGVVAALEPPSGVLMTQQESRARLHQRHRSTCDHVCHHLVWHLDQQRALAQSVLAFFKQREAVDLQYAAALK
eukprot:EG_transcript_29004